MKINNIFKTQKERPAIFNKKRKWLFIYQTEKQTTSLSLAVCFFKDLGLTFMLQIATFGVVFWVLCQ